MKLPPFSLVVALLLLSTVVSCGSGEGEDAANPRSTEAVVLTPGDAGSFTSPSQNIACSMSIDAGVSCWISEKEWSTAAVPGPGCEDADFGNAVDVTDAGVDWPCYTDLAWDTAAPVLAHGGAMQVGDFQCKSAETGITCRNASGDGFRLARSAIAIF